MPDARRRPRACESRINQSPSSRHGHPHPPPVTSGGASPDTAHQHRHRGLLAVRTISRRISSSIEPCAPLRPVPAAPVKGRGEQRTLHTPERLTAGLECLDEVASPASSIGGSSRRSASSSLPRRPTAEPCTRRERSGRRAARRLASSWSRRAAQTRRPLNGHGLVGVLSSIADGGGRHECGSGHAASAARERGDALVKHHLWRNQWLARPR